MSVSYYAFVARELDEEARDWFTQKGLTFPPLPPGDFPTAAQMAAQVEGAGEFQAVWHSGRDDHLTVIDPHTPEAVTLEVRRTGIQTDSPRELYFHRGRESLIVSVCRTLSWLTGPLLLCNDFGSALVVHPGMGTDEWRSLA